MTKTRAVIYTVTIVGLLALLYHLRHKHDNKVQADIHSTILPSEDREKVIIDVHHHTIATVSRRGDGSTHTTMSFLPNGGASVEVKKNGSVVVTAPKWGTERTPFIGAAFGSDVRLRAALGLNLLYYTRWEAGVGVVSNMYVRDGRVFGHVSYNFYDNYFASLAVDNRKTIHVMAGIKF